jgi:hypothetical protein
MLSLSFFGVMCGVGGVLLLPSRLLHVAGIMDPGAHELPSPTHESKKAPNFQLRSFCSFIIVDHPIQVLLYLQFMHNLRQFNLGGKREKTIGGIVVCRAKRAEPIRTLMKSN